LPTKKTLVGPLPHTADSTEWILVWRVIQEADAPSERSTWPSWVTAKMLEGPLPQMSLMLRRLPELSLCQLLPS